MGSPDNSISHTEASEILSVSCRQLRRLVRRGFIYPLTPGDSHNEPRYRVEEVHALADVREQKLDMPSVAMLAVQAQALSRTVSSKLDQICHFLGIQNYKLGTGEDDIFDLYARVREELRVPPEDWRTGSIMEWAAVINAIDEAYLDLLARHTLDESPWEYFLQLANEIMLHRARATDANLDFAFACLDAARRNLRNVAYLYVLGRHGYKVANKIFIKSEVTDAVISNLYPREVEPA